MLLYIFFGVGICIISVIFRLASSLGLTIPLAYGLIAPTLFYDWFHSHQQLAEGIGWALLTLVAACWLISLIRKIIGIVQKHRDAEIEDMILLHRIKNGQSVDVN